MDIEQNTLKDALLEAAEYHHEYETNLLGGMYDEAWADWYGAFLIGKVAELSNPSYLTQLLQMAADMHEREVNQATPWAEFYAEYVIQHFQHKSDMEEEE